MSSVNRAAVSIALSALALSGCGAGTATLRGDAATLAPCSAKRCVSSLDTAADYHVEPLHYSGSAAAARAKLVSVLRALPRTDVVTENPDYVYAQVTTPTLRFIDDVEFLFGTRGVIEVRSSSRAGYYDFGVNRERVEVIRRQFEARP